MAEIADVGDVFPFIQNIAQLTDRLFSLFDTGIVRIFKDAVPVLYGGINPSPDDGKIRIVVLETWLISLLYNILETSGQYQPALVPDRRQTVSKPPAAKVYRFGILA